MAGEWLIDQLPVAWEYTTLGEACARDGGDVQTGPFGSQLRAADYVPHGIPSIMPQNIGDNRVVRDGIFQIAVEDAERLNRYRVRTGDIVYSRRGDVEKRALIREAEDGWLCGTGCLRLRFGGEHVDGTFASYYLGHPDVRAWIVRHAHGATMPNLNTAILSALPFVLAPLDEQRAIAHILGTLDDKIELNRRMSETLEAMARALFKSWFVDFDPIRAKAAGRDPGLPQPIADLFPDSFEDSELGEIPKGWEVKPLSDCVDVVRGLSYKGSGLSSSEDGLPMHNLNSIYEGGGYKHDGVKHYQGEYRPQHVARAGDLIVANTEQGHHRLLIGYSAIVPARFGGQSLFSHHIYRVRTRTSSGLTADYLCHLLNTSVMHETVSGYANGTTVNMLPMDGLQTPQVLVPPSRVVVAFNAIAETTRTRHEEMVEEGRTLAALRDALLPKLIPTALRVEDAERFIGECA